MKKKNFLVAAVMISSRLLAQDQGDSTSSASGASSYTELGRIIITAHKSNQRQSATGKVVNVILPEQIEQSKGRTLSEVLNTIPGVSINGANNNLGTNQTVNIRGASAGNVLILIDGIPVNDPSVITNYYDLNLLPIDQVERIEIVKGGQSTLYGSDAVAGVINIITKKPAEKSFAFNASASGGSYTTFKNTAGISGTNRSISYNLQYTDVYSQGFSAAYDSTGKKDFDKDGFRQHVLYGGMQWQLTQQLQAKFNGRLSNYNTAVDASAFTDDKDFTSTSKNWQGGAGLSYKLNKGQINLNYLYNKVVRTYTDDSSYRSSPFGYFSDSKYEGITHFAELYGNYNTAHVELLAGIDFRSNKTNQDYFSLGAFGPFSSSLKDTLAKMWQLSPYASVILKNDEGLSVEAGIRLNHHSEYGNNITYTFNPCYLIHRKLKIFGNLYSAFKAPALYQLFDPVYGNKDLKPEKSTTVEGGAEYFFTENFRTRAVYFYRDTKDAIQFLLVDPNFFIFQYKNVNRQKSQGIEWEASYKTGRWQWDANYTHISGKTISAFDETGSELPRDTTYNNLYHIPKDVINISAGVFIKKLFIKLQLKTVSKRLEYVYASQPKILEGYYTLDLYGDYSFSKKCRVFLDLKNITSQRYFDILGYNSRRFNFMAGVSVNL
jgi:vitamin B12 transporter